MKKKMQIVSSSLKNTKRIILTASYQKGSNVWQMYDGLIRPHFFLAEAVRVGRTRTHLWVGCQFTVARGGEGRKGERLPMSMRLLFGVMHLFRNYIMMLVAHLCKYPKTHLIVYFQGVNFVIKE